MESWWESSSQFASPPLLNEDFPFTSFDDSVETGFPCTSTNISNGIFRRHQPLTVSRHQGPSPANITMTTPHRLGLESSNSGGPSDYDIARQFYIPRTAYDEEPRKDAIGTSWRTYLEWNNYRSAFLPLRGTERDRYRPIIKEAKGREIQKRRVADSILNKITETKMRGKINETFDQDCVRLHLYLQGGPRHSRQRPVFLKYRYKTRFGILVACSILPDEHWYLGHRPGDPIVRIRPDPVNYGAIKEGNMFYRSPGGAQAEMYETVFEGVVPFNVWELYQRFTRYALPAFVQMAIAAVGFDPRDEKHGAHPWAQEVDYIRTSEFGEITDRDRTANLSLLRRIWKIKYGTDQRNYPQFLKDQIAISMSSFREMGWLMSNLERDAHGVVSHHYWEHCKSLLQDFSGHDTTTLAQEHIDFTLASETVERLEDGDTENILIYCQSKEGHEKVKIRDLYDSRGPGTELTLLDINNLRDATIKAASARWSPTPSPTHSPTDEGPIIIACPATARKKQGAKSRKRSNINRDRDDTSAPPPKKRAEKNTGRPSKA
ncbi:hypothetical protein F5Y12DRAFT_720149 [Xylaria sp. FL1777]|nr:hypothetical protein F5Y12DRAFT_720149 [Xylaria sp. FL1777]